MEVRRYSASIEICDGITFDFYTRLPHIVNAVLYQVLNFAQRVKICATEKLDCHIYEVKVQYALFIWYA